MARDRNISSDFWTREAVIDCAPMTRLLYLGLQNFADDHGVQPLRPRTIRLQVFPGDDLDNEQVRAMIDEMAARGLVRIYEVEGVEYLAVVDWEQMQRVGKRARRRYPPVASTVPGVGEAGEQPSSATANHRNGESGAVGQGHELPSPTSESHSKAETPRSPPFGEAGEQWSRATANHRNAETPPEPHAGKEAQLPSRSLGRGHPACCPPVETPAARAPQGEVAAAAA